MILKEFLAWLPALLTLVGWFLVNHQNNAREARKEARSAADRCKTLARDAAHLGMQYWQQEPKIPSWQIKAVLEELEVEVCRFPEDRGRREILNKYIDLVEAITCDEFEAGVMHPRESTSPVMREIVRTRSLLLAEVEKQFQAHFQDGELRRTLKTLEHDTRTV